MVQVNPEIPFQNAPSYLGLSKPIDQPQGNDSLKTLFSGIGNLIKGGATLYEETTKADINNKLYGAVDYQREAFTGALEDVSGVPVQNRVSDNMSTNNILGNPKEMPSDVTNFTQKAENIQKAAMQGGRVNDTYYTSRLNIIAKDLRSQYPGWRDYIDTTMHKITGVNPANAYIQNLMADLNARGTQVSDTFKADMAYVRSNAHYLPDGGAMAAHMVETRQWDTSKLVHYVSPFIKAKAEADIAQARLSTRNAGLEWQKIDAGKALTQHNFNMAAAGWKGAMLGSNITPKHLEEYANEAIAGTFKMPDQEAGALGDGLIAYRDNLANQMYTDAVNRGYVELLGEKAVQDKIQASLFHFNHVIEKFKNKEYGLAFRAARMVDATINSSSDDLLNDEELRAYFRNAGAINRLGGPQAGAEWFKHFILDGRGGQSIDDYMKIYLRNQKIKLAGQANATPLVLSDIMKDLVGHDVGGIRSGEPDRTGSKQVYQEIPNFSDGVTADLPEPLKKNVAKGVYSPANSNFLSFYDNDAVNKYGRESVFQTMTSDDKINALWNLGKKDKKIWTDAKVWAERSFSNYIFGPRLKNLNTMAQSPNVQIGWDTDSHSIIFRAKPANPTEKITYDAWAREVENLNKGLHGMQNFAEKEGKDIDAYLLNLLISNGVDPKGETVPSAIIRSLKAAHPTKEEGSSALPFARESRKEGSLKSFLKNPIESVVGKANAAEVNKEWGNPYSPSFKKDHLTDIQLQSGKTIKVNKKAAEAFQGFLNELEGMGYPIKTIGGYSLRGKKRPDGSASNELSQHAFGNAIDINPRRNPQGGKKTDLPPNISQIAAKHGISWGGDWSPRYRDPMHFEFVGGQ